MVSIAHLLRGENLGKPVATPGGDEPLQEDMSAKLLRAFHGTPLEVDMQPFSLWPLNQERTTRRSSLHVQERRFFECWRAGLPACRQAGVPAARKAAIMRMAVDMAALLDKIGQSMEGTITLDPAAMTEHMSVAGEDYVKQDPATWTALAGAIDLRAHIRHPFTLISGVLLAYIDSRGR